MSDPKHIVWLDSVRNCPLFANLSESDLRDLLGIASARQVDRGEYLFHEGDPVSGFFLIRVGAISVQRISPRGEEKVIHVFRRGDTFAEGALTSSAYPADALAIEACDLLHFSQNGYLDLLATKKEFSARTILSLCRHMRRLVSQIENCGRESASCRLTRWLLERAGSPSGNGPCRVELGIRKSALAGELQMRNETLSRAFAKLSDQGLIEVNKTVVTIPDPEMLRATIDS